MTNILKAKSAFRRLGVNLIADKVKTGGGGTWKFASEENLIRTVQEPMTKCGLEYVFRLENRDDGLYVIGELYHLSGEKIATEKRLNTVEPKKDRNGNQMYLDAEIEVGKQVGYWRRMFLITLLGISDVDPEDIANSPRNLENVDKLIKELKALGSDEPIVQKWILETYKAPMESLSESALRSIKVALENRKEHKKEKKDTKE